MRRPLAKTALGENINRAVVCLTLKVLIPAQNCLFTRERRAVVDVKKEKKQTVSVGCITISATVNK